MESHKLLKSEFYEQSCFIIGNINDMHNRFGYAEKVAEKNNETNFKELQIMQDGQNQSTATQRIEHKSDPRLQD